MFSYRDQVTEEHDVFCIAHALQSHMENCADSNVIPATIEEALESAYTLIAEGIASCYCRFSTTTGQARIDYLDNFSDSALEAMVQGGYRNEFTGELMSITPDEYAQTFNQRHERNERWLAETIANEVVGDQNSANAIIASDTEPVALYVLQVNGKNSEHGMYTTKWGIAYAVARELQAVDVDPDTNHGIIAAVIASIRDNSMTTSSNLDIPLTFTVKHVGNN